MVSVEFHSASHAGLSTRAVALACAVVLAVSVVPTPVGAETGASATRAVVARRRTDRTGPTLDVRLSPMAATAGEDVRSLLRVDPHPDNRRLTVTVDSGLYFASTEVQLEGLQARRSHYLTWRTLPGGEYTLTAVLAGSTGARARVVRTFIVAGAQP